MPALPRLRRGVIHGDANDHNVLVGTPHAHPREVTGLLDFGDMHHGLLVAEPAVAAAYALLGQDDPLAAAAAVVAGYHAALPLEAEEIALLFALVGARLAVSVTNSAMRARAAAGDPYVTVSEAPAWAALERLDRVHPRFAHYAFREACGLPPVPHGPALVSWLERAESGPRPRRGPADDALPRPRPRRRQPLPRRRPRGRRDRPADGARLRRDAAGGCRDRRGPLRRGARDLPVARLRAGESHRRAAHGPPRDRPLRRAGHDGPRAAATASSTSSPTTPRRRTTGRSSSSATRPRTTRPSSRSTAT